MLCNDIITNAKLGVCAHRYLYLELLNLYLVVSLNTCTNIALYLEIFLTKSRWVVLRAYFTCISLSEKCHRKMLEMSFRSL